MILKKIKKLLLKQGYDETKVDDLLKELENETDDEVDETESKEVVEEFKEKEVE